jgi:cytidylate kinase
VAIDGPSGAGKSTAGMKLAERLGYTYVNTGAMYRALALKALRTGTPLDSPERLAALARETRIELTGGGRGVRLDGDDATAAIKTREVSGAASRVSVHTAVRRHMVARQQELGREGGVVLDGRDIGSAVFPDAEAKFYLDAEPARRAVRRQAELAAAGEAAELGAIEGEIRARDLADATREDSPLVRAPGAVLLDTTNLTPEQVVERMLEVVLARAAASP